MQNSPFLVAAAFRTPSLVLGKLLCQSLIQKSCSCRHPASAQSVPHFKELLLNICAAFSAFQESSKCLLQDTCTFFFSRDKESWKLWSKLRLGKFEWKKAKKTLWCEIWFWANPQNCKVQKTASPKTRHITRGLPHQLMPFVTEGCIVLYNGSEAILWISRQTEIQKTLNFIGTWQFKAKDEK